MPTSKKPVPVWPCETVTIKGDKYFRLPFPTGVTMTIPAADGMHPELCEKLAQLCVRARANEWARKTFPKAFNGI